ncbi:MAG: MATE family efflux transporter [Lachnospiraceae bacterium]|nr:MATE family efflux transporter [Lachnospiraceae bacterium]
MAWQNTEEYKDLIFMTHQTAKNQSIDMTAGSVFHLLIRFAVPLLIGNLFQQLYNTVDSLVVGNFVGTQALAAVGSTTSIINTVVRFFNGVSIGAGVILSRCYGAHDEKALSRSVATTLTLTFLCSIFFTVLGVVSAPHLLRLMSTPDDVMESASRYLSIYFSGVSGLLIYNMGSAVLRAVGDTRRPLYFLCFSSVLNIFLDLLLVLVFPLGVSGVAYATVISQTLSAALILFVIWKDQSTFHFRWKQLRLEPSIALEIFVIGCPVGIQQSLTALSNVYVQSFINGFGSSCMAGWSCYSKIDQFIILPIQSMGQASTTFVSQNIGAGNIKRAKSGTSTALLLALGVTFCSAVLLWIFAPSLVSLFNQDSMVIHYGAVFLRLCVFFTCFSCFNQVLAGALRGTGDSRTPMLFMLISYVGFRQLYLTLAVHILYIPAVVGFAYPAGWIFCSLLMSTYYLSGKWEKKLS